MMKLLIFSAALILVLLLSLAAYYHWRLWQKKREQRENVAYLQALFERRQRENAASIVYIARAFLEDNLSLTEAAIRIDHLAKGLPIEETLLHQFKVFSRIVEETAHVPILDEWRALDREQQRAYDELRSNVESKYLALAKPLIEKIASEESIAFSQAPESRA